MTGVSAIQPGAALIACHLAPTRFRGEGSSTYAAAGAAYYAEPSRSEMLLREPLAGTTVHTLPGTLGHFPASFSQARRMNGSRMQGRDLSLFRLTSEGFVGSNPTAPTIFEYLIWRVIT